MAEEAPVNWTASFARRFRLTDDVKRALLRESRVASVSQGAIIFGPGKAPENLLLLLDGMVCVQQTSGPARRGERSYSTGGRHESCVLTTTCLLAYEDCSAEGVAESDLHAVLVPRRTFVD